jgi:hypothetical protein
VEEQVPVSERLAFEDQRGLVRAGELSVQGGDVEDQDEDYPSDGTGNPLLPAALALGPSRS